MKGGSPRIIEVSIPLTKVISIKIDVETLKETDALYRKRGFKSRSEFIREAILLYVELLKKYDRDELKKVLSTVLGIDTDTPRKKDKPQQYTKLLADII